MTSAQRNKLKHKVPKVWFAQHKAASSFLSLFAAGRRRFFWLSVSIMLQSGHIMCSSDPLIAIAPYHGRIVQLRWTIAGSGQKQKKRENKLCLCFLLSCEVYQCPNGQVILHVSLSNKLMLTVCKNVWGTLCLLVNKAKSGQVLRRRVINQREEWSLIHLSLEKALFL
jgi:hypothetical protein